MTSLYEISQTHNQALLNMADMDDLPEEVINDTLEMLEGDFKDKAISVAAFFLNQEADIKAMKDAEKRIADRRKSIENRVNWMKNYLLSNMQRTGITSIDCPQFSIKLRNNPESVKVLDEDLIPDEYIVKKIEHSVDKVAIKNAIKSGEKIDGVELVRSQSIMFK
jgi:uncharacterized protein YeeX (DUF496 family)